MNPGSSRARTQLRSRVRAAVHAAILDAAEELFATGGVQHTQMAAIASRAGVAVGTLYNYYADRDALVGALFESRRAALVPQIREVGAAAAALPVEARLRAFVTGVLALFDANHRFLRIALETEHLRRGPGGKPAMTSIVGELAAIVDAGVAAGAIAPRYAALAPRLLAGAIRTALILRAETGEPAAPHADALVDLLAHGLLR